MHRCRNVHGPSIHACGTATVLPSIDLIGKAHLRWFRAQRIVCRCHGQRTLRGACLPTILAGAASGVWRISWGLVADDVNMTTIYSAPSETQRVRPVDIPSYSYQYPSHVNTVQLAAVKEGIFHPRLPTLRRYDMDTVAQKLPSEHSRTTTSLKPGKLTNLDVCIKITAASCVFRPFMGHSAMHMVTLCNIT